MQRQLITRRRSQHPVFATEVQILLVYRLAFFGCQWLRPMPAGSQKSKNKDLIQESGSEELTVDDGERIEFGEVDIVVIAPDFSQRRRIKRSCNDLNSVGQYCNFGVREEAGD